MFTFFDFVFLLPSIA